MTSLILLFVLRAQAGEITLRRPDPFAHVLAFGASVTHGTPAMLPGFDWAVRRVEDWATWRGWYERPAAAPANPRPYGRSPVDYLVTHYRGKKAAKRIKYVSRWRTTRDEDLGSAQTSAMLDGPLRADFDRASMIIGVDAFYWDAGWNTCGLELDEIIREFIRTAGELGKILVLGTVPIENASNVRIDSQRIGYRIWYPPNPRCATRINALLAESCLTENGCYVVDLKAHVDRLNAGGHLRLRDGRHFGLFEMRPDGVHLSDVGSRHLAESIMDAFAWNPPPGLNQR